LIGDERHLGAGRGGRIEIEAPSKATSIDHELPPVDNTAKLM
jgi:hypothetical protein